MTVRGCAAPPASQVRPPSVERLNSRLIWNGEVKLNAWHAKYAVPSGPKATAGSPPASKNPVPGTLGSFVNRVTPGTNPLGSVGVHVFPPSNVALTAQPSLKFQSLAPVRRLLEFRGFAAIGVSFCAVVSRLTSTTNTDGPWPPTAKLGCRAVGAGEEDSLQAIIYNEPGRHEPRVHKYVPHCMIPRVGGS